MRPEDRWDLLLSSRVHIIIIKELALKSLKDCEPSYIKALFLLLKPRLLSSEDPIAIVNLFKIINGFYNVNLFLEHTFFQALIELHNEANKKALIHQSTAYLEKKLIDVYKSFCQKSVCRDTDIGSMSKIPLPIQRKLSRDGHFLKFFACHVHDLVALETPRHILKREDIINFFRMIQINGKVLEALAENKLVMQEQQNKIVFCSHPKASPDLLRKYLSTLPKFEIKKLAENRNASQVARTLATNYMSKYKM